ncbi:MAG: tripartite tricarboxylate transporter substrate binding protein [Burkholderiales bacterium]|nr:tripartite tricarboxylate transporter substrate binding protein [Burkholderiales bacterium]
MKYAWVVLGSLCLGPQCFASDGASTYPQRPVRMVNPFPPGGSSDPMCRLLADALTRALGQQFVVDNRGGGNGNIGTALVAKANPDGYTVLFGSGTTFTINPYVYRSQGFDPKKDFTPVIRFAAVPNVLVLNPSLPARSLTEFTEYVKARPGALNYASAGNGSSMHLAAELYQKMSGTKMLHIPFVSPGQATQDTMANRTQLIFHLVAAVYPQVQAGNLRALAVLDKSRSGVLPAVPTTAEAGLPGLESGTWYVIMTPAGTPAGVAANLNQAVNRELANPAFRKRVVEMGGSLLGGSAAEVMPYIETEARKWSEVVRVAGIKLD